MLYMRCSWVKSEQVEIDYHDHEWGVECHDERYLFEQLMLECFQSGLSWSTIIKKRQAFRERFDNFDANKIANYDEVKINELKNDPTIIRHEAKIRAVINNAQAYIEMLEAGLSFDKYFWGFTNGPSNISGLEVTNNLSDEISKDLKKRGFKYVGSITVFAYLQAIGIYNSHEKSCEMRREYE